ncbi:MAG: flavoprotein [Micrococcaceae bacterium]
MKVVLGVCAGIAAYKATFLVRAFKEAGHDVKVVPTENSYNFIGKATWEALSGNKVTSNVFDDVENINHVKVAKEADVIIVTPATANFIAKTRAGLADDLLSDIMLMATCPIILAPAMHTEMWNNPATQENVKILKERGFKIFGPASGRLTGKDTGNGRMEEPVDIYKFVMEIMQ